MQSKALAPFIRPCLHYFHISEQQPCFFLGSSPDPILTFSDLKGCCWAAIELFEESTKFLDWPFWGVPFFSKGSFAMAFVVLSTSSSLSWSGLLFPPPPAFKSNEKSLSLPSFHSLRISSASWLSSPSGRKGLSQPW